MSEKILVVGGVALGPKAACRCKRLMPDAQITLVDENELISYGGCGIPYYVSGEIQNLDDLRSTPYHTVRDPAFFQAMKGLNVRTRTRALAIDRAAQTLLVKDLNSGKEEKLPYDKLVLATGASPRMPPVEGKDLKNVLSLTRLEAAVALADMWGVKVSVVEMMDQILPGVLSHSLALMAAHDCQAHKVDVHVSEKVLKIEGTDGAVSAVVTDKRRIPAQMVIFAAGFTPNGGLAKEAGLEVAPFGAIVVDEHMRTSDPAIYAGGDCVCIKNIITGKPGYLPLGSMANRQGRVIGTNLAGGDATFPGYVGSWAVKLFDMAFCGVGLTVERARKEGYDALSVGVEQLDHAHFYPEKSMMTLELVVDKPSRRVLGLQGACADPDSLKARIDAVAAALQYSKPTVDDISNLEVAYAPPFASAMDVVNAVANVADNALDGRFTPITGDTFMELWKNREQNHVFFIDARPAAAGRAVQEKHPDWHAIPLEEIAARANEVPKDRPVAIICNTGLRAYDSLLILARSGVKELVNASGGMQSVIKMGLSV